LFAQQEVDHIEIDLHQRDKTEQSTKVVKRSRKTHKKASKTGIQRIIKRTHRRFAFRKRKLDTIKIKTT